MERRFPIARKLILLLGDIGIVVLASYLSVLFLLNKDVLNLNENLYYGMIPILVILTGVLFNIHGLFTLEKKRCAEIFLSLLVALFNLLIIMMAFNFFIREFSYSRGVLLLTIGLQFIFTSIWKYSFWRMEKFLHQPTKALLMGSEEECIRVFQRLKLLPSFNLVLKYICTHFAQDEWKKFIGEIDLIIVCSDLSLRDKSNIVHFCNMNQKQVVLIPAVYEVFCTGMELDKIDDIPVFRPQSLRPSLEQRSLKRILDVAVAGMGFCVALPFMMLIAVIIKIFDPGPVFYSQIRTGRYEKIFKVYKFRTMRVDAEEMSGPVLASENDPRITPLGHFMRATRLDELPQIWNVLIGDMSLVGPRPERPYFVEQFKKEIPEYVYRHNVKPGITGLAQVYGKYNTTAYDKLIYDLMYIQKCNIINDLVIMVQTARVLVTKSATEGTAKNKENVSWADYKIKDIYGDFKKNIIINRGE